MKKIISLIFIVCCFCQLEVTAQTCGNCVNADFAAGCDNGVTTSNDANGTFIGTGITGAAQVFNPSIFVPGGSNGFVLSQYCTDFTTPLTVNGNSEFGLGGLSLLLLVEDPDDIFNDCGFDLAEITLYDGNCTSIAPAGGLDVLGLWDTWSDTQICCNTTYTICFQYTNVQCPLPQDGLAVEMSPELYYIAEDDDNNGVDPIPTPNFTVSDVCSGEPINWANNGCAGLAAGDDIVELYQWTGGCTPTDPTFSGCGIDDIADIDVGGNLTRVGGDFTCASLPTSPGIAWDVVCNDPCDPKTVTFYAIVRNVESDCDGDGNFDYRSENGLIRYDVLVYPPQPITEIDPAATNPATSGQTNVMTVEIGYDVDASGTLDGNEICATKMADAPTNETCDPIDADITITWTAAEIEALTGAPASLACYATATETETITVNPPPPGGMTACDDGVDCTINDMEILAADGVTVCTPCAGTPVDCSTAGQTTVQACDDGDPCTINDEETILNCDNSVCVPCAGTAVTPPQPAFDCPASGPQCGGLIALNPVDNAASGGVATWSGSGAVAVDANNEFDPSGFPVGATVTLTYTIDNNGCIASVDCSFEITSAKISNAGSFSCD